MLLNTKREQTDQGLPLPLPCPSIPVPWEMLKEIRGRKRQYSTETWDTVAFSCHKNSGLKVIYLYGTTSKNNLVALLSVLVAPSEMSKSKLRKECLLTYWLTNRNYFSHAVGQPE